MTMLRNLLATARLDPFAINIVCTGPRFPSVGAHRRQRYRSLLDVIDMLGTDEDLKRCHATQKDRHPSAFESQDRP
ncbi:hypothetical protein K227x_18840 [Rubripirellula lacrimiformis]|uniref:Uncharacterized protein n=1 Tax=Rubripirellula lacrimiformis TaxID=1930273 RepID=A0A517N8P2_9BACT|nr:hypothetical protein K227x_18840 [Rubripirellula lacrimiformis]